MILNLKINSNFTELILQYEFTKKSDLLELYRKLQDNYFLHGMVLHMGESNLYASLGKVVYIYLVHPSKDPKG